MIHDLPEENSPINETLRLLQEEFPLKTLSKKYQEGSAFEELRYKLFFILSSISFFYLSFLIFKNKEILKTLKKQRFASLHESTDQLPMHVILERVVNF